MRHVLVCGGAGYVGAQLAKNLAAAGCKVTVFDNISTGHREAVQWGSFVEGDLRDRAALDQLFSAHRFDAVMHLAALSQVGESMRLPLAYYENSVTGSLNLLNAMHRAGVERLVFSSTAAVYGTPQQPFIDESHPTLPISPYGASKLMVERMLEDAAQAHGLRSVALRYFNAAGADSEGETGESHAPETHLIPNVLRCALGQGEALQVFGTDYDTRDGTCVRDYIHVHDLAQAHVLALDYLGDHTGAHSFNLGSGQGYSVMEVIETARHVTGKPIPFNEAPRRAGDPPVLVADAQHAKSQLGWQPRFDDIVAIVESAWRWCLAPHY
jgi:UDP-glucose 4-epimerase